MNCHTKQILIILFLHSLIFVNIPLAPGPKRSIFYSTGKTIRRISLDTDDLTSFMLPTKYHNKTKIVSFVVTKNSVIWTDGTKIYSSLKNDSGRPKWFMFF